ncbi:MAG: DUF4494 domain-containing protein [Bacteroides sp.]
MTHNWFECKVRYEKMQPNGVSKKVTESYLVDALSCTEAEARTIEEMSPYITGDFQISSVKKVDYSDLFLGEGDYFFKCKVAFVTLDEKTGAEKESSTNMLVQALDLREAVRSLDKGMEGSMADYLIKSVSETKIMDVFLYNKESEASNEQ